MRYRDGEGTIRTVPIAWTDHIMEPMFNDFDVIYCYTRKQAIEDGALIDVTFTAQEAGFGDSGEPVITIMLTDED